MRARARQQPLDFEGLHERALREPVSQPPAALRSIPSATRASPPGSCNELWLAVQLARAVTSEELERIALRAQRFTPRVSLVPPDGLLLEVKGSLHLFHGAEELREAVRRECVLAGAPLTVALAPTPLAALAIARAGKTWILTDTASLIGQLAPLTLKSLRWSHETLERLSRMGVRTIGQALRLPRAGFVRRFGGAQLAMLDRLTGRSADLRTCFRERERFRGRCDLTHELTSQTLLLTALTPLLRDLGAFLRARQRGIVQLICILRHRHAPPTRCTLRLAEPVADVARIAKLLEERLDRLTLPEPVRSCELRSGALLRRELPSATLWQPGEQGGAFAHAASGALLERLRARLGAEAVHGLALQSEHRPENAWRAVEPILQPSAQQPAMRERQRRPLWILQAPVLLTERNGRPQLAGPLRLVGEAERIETGWWDGGEIARDYYSAVDPSGTRLWVFRERSAPHCWFLHGVFG